MRAAPAARLIAVTLLCAAFLGCSAVKPGPPKGPAVPVDPQSALATVTPATPVVESEAKSTARGQEPKSLQIRPDSPLDSTAKDISD
jgi:hypothetical protein